MMQGSIRLGDIDMQKLDAQEKEILRKSVSITIANVTKVPLSYVQDVSIDVESKTRRLGEQASRENTIFSWFRRLTLPTALVKFKIVGNSQKISEALKSGGAPSSGTSLSSQIADKIGSGGGSVFLQSLVNVLVTSNPTNPNFVSALATATFQGVNTIDTTPTMQPTSAPKSEDEVDILIIVLPVVLGTLFLVAVAVLLYYMLGKTSQKAISQNASSAARSANYDLVAKQNEATF